MVRLKQLEGFFLTTRTVQNFFEEMRVVDKIFNKAHSFASYSVETSHIIFHLSSEALKMGIIIRQKF